MSQVTDTNYYKFVLSTPCIGMGSSPPYLSVTGTESVGGVNMTTIDRGQHGAYNCIGYIAIAIKT